MTKRGGRPESGYKSSSTRIAVVLAVLALGLGIGPGLAIRPASAGTPPPSSVATSEVPVSEVPVSEVPASEAAVSQVTSPEADPQQANPSGQADKATRDRIVADIRSDDSAPGVDVLGSLFGDADQPADWDHYDIGASVGPVSRLNVYYTRLIFAAGMWIIAFARWVLSFVLRFDLGRMLVGDIGTLADQYHTLINGGQDGLALKEFMLLTAVAHAGWQIFRHRGHAALAELLVALAIALTGGYLLTNADTTACRGMSTMGELTVGMIALGSPRMDQSQARADYCGPSRNLPDPGLVFEETMLDTFVHEPFLLLQWGVVPQPGSTCRHVADALVQTRSWDNDNKPRDFMRKAGCEQMAEFNKEMTSQRTAGALAYSMTAAAFAVAMIVSAGTLLVAQMAGALLVLSLPFALVVGISPGVGRELLARWGHSLLKVAILFMGSGFFLSLLVTSVHAIQADAEQRSILLRMVASVAVAWGLVFLRGRIFKSMRFGAHSLTSRVAGPNADVGPQGRGPGQATTAAALQALEVAGTVHAGAQVAAGASKVAMGGIRGVGNATRRVRLERHHAAAAVDAPVSPHQTLTSRRRRRNHEPPDEAQPKPVRFQGHGQVEGVGTVESDVPTDDAGP